MQYNKTYKTVKTQCIYLRMVLPRPAEVLGDVECWVDPHASMELKVDGAGVKHSTSNGPINWDSTLRGRPFALSQTICPGV